MWKIEDVRKATYKVLCGSEQGTAFYVGSNELLTAWHVVSGFLNCEKVFLCNGEERWECEVIIIKENTDVALLKCEKTFNSPLKLSSVPKINEMSLKMFGYPQSRIGAQLGFDLDLKTSRHYENLKEDFDSYAEITDERRFSIMNGFSGSPVFVEDGIVIGVVTDKLDCHIGFVSVKSIEESLETKGIFCDKSTYKYDNSPYGWVKNKKIIDEIIGKVGARYQPELHQNDPILENKINRLWDLSIDSAEHGFDNLISFIGPKNKSDKIKDRFLYLFGNAGVGKTHQVCHFAQTLVNDEKTNVYLCLGAMFDSVKANSLEETFANLCGFPNSTEYMETLNENAKKRNVRYLFIIDAINEGLDKDFWNQELPIFTNKLSKFANLALVVTIRKPFEKEYGVDKEKFSSYNLKGFVNPIQARQSFFTYYGIESDATQFNFVNGLMLSLFCKTYKNIPINQREYLKSILYLFILYVKIRNVEVSKLVNEDPYRNVTHDYLCKLCLESINNNCNPVSRNVARRISNKILYRQWSESLLYTMLKENLLLAAKDKSEDCINFEYELMENVYQAIALFEQKKNAKDAILFLKNMVKTGKITARVHNFIVVATSIWDEFYRQDIFFNDLFDKNLLSYYIEGIKYKKEINLNVLKEIKSNSQYGMFSFCKIALKTLINDDQKLLSILLNALASMNQHDRDLNWTESVNQCYDDDEILYLLYSDYKPHSNEERGDTYKKYFMELLCWTCSSSYSIVRVLTIRHLVQSLLLMPQYAIELLKKMQVVDDPYILDGVYSALYGVILLSTDKKLTSNIAKIIYDYSFKNRSPYPDLRVREWMLRILDRDRFVNGSDYFEKSKPPYSSEKIINVQNVDDSIENLKASFGQTKGAKKLIVSLFGFGDFARYIIGTNSSKTHREISSVFLCNENHLKFEGYDLQQELFQIGEQIVNFGWKEDLGTLDNNRSSFNRMTNERERIGKKYQWMALYNIEARLLDMYKILDANDFKRLSYRDINYPWYTSRHSYFDPTLGISTNETENSNFEIIPFVDFAEHLPNDKWMKQNITKKDVENILTFFDKKRNKWILLKSRQILRASSNQLKDAFVLYDSFFVESEKKFEFEKWISKQELYGQWLPEISDSIDFILLEYAWSSIINWDEYKEMKYVDKGCPCHVLPGTCSQLQEEHMGVNDQLAGSVYLPNPDIMHALNLHVLPGYERRNTYFADEKDDVLCCFIQRSGMDYVYLREDALEKYLKERKFSMFASIATEKYIRSESLEYKNDDFKTSSCAIMYNNENHKIKWINSFRTKKQG